MCVLQMSPDLSVQKSTMLNSEGIQPARPCVNNRDRLLCVFVLLCRASEALLVNVPAWAMWHVVC